MNYLRDAHNYWRMWDMNRNNLSNTKNTYKTVTWTKSETTGPVGTVVREEIYVDDNGKKDSYYDEYKVDRDGNKSTIKNDGNDKLKYIVTGTEVKPHEGTESESST